MLLQHWHNGSLLSVPLLWRIFVNDVATLICYKRLILIIVICLVAFYLFNHREVLVSEATVTITHSRMQIACLLVPSMRKRTIFNRLALNKTTT